MNFELNHTIKLQLGQSTVSQCLRGTPKQSRSILKHFQVPFLKSKNFWSSFTFLYQTKDELYYGQMTVKIMKIINGELGGMGVRRDFNFFLSPEISWRGLLHPSEYWFSNNCFIVLTILFTFYFYLHLVVDVAQFHFEIRSKTW